MAGIVTQTRDVTTPLPWRHHGTVAGPTWNTGDASVANAFKATQVTTSFRGSRSEIVPDEEGFSDATSLVDFYRKMGDSVRKNRSGFDTGHAFNTVKSVLELSHPNFLVTGTTYPNLAYEGPLIVLGTNILPSISQFPSVATPDLSYYGTRAIAETIPTNSVADLAVGLAELLREGAPKLVGKAVLSSAGPLGLIKALGDEFLNFQFGYKPMGRDIGETLHALTSASALVEQYKRDSGRMVRRRMTFPTERTVSVTYASSRPLDLTSRTPSWTVNLSVGTGPVTIVTETTTKRWFSGAYTYHLPTDNDLLSRMDAFTQKADKLLGLGLDPEALWNVMPWSWLTDWFANIGQIAHNLSAFSQDALVMRYGFMMAETTTTKTFSHPGIVTQHGSASGPISCKFSTTRKTRVQASPYGFSSNPNSFTDRQWAILAALGMSKGGSHTLR